MSDLEDLYNKKENQLLKSKFDTDTELLKIINLDKAFSKLITFMD